MTTRNFLLGVAILAGGAVYAATPTSGVRTLPDGSTLVSTPDGSVQVTPVNANVFRVTASPDGSPVDLPASQSAIATPDPSSVKVISTPSQVILSSPTTKVKIDRATGRVKFYDANDELLLSEEAGVDNSDAMKTVTFQGGGKENFFGAGERGHSLTLNGDTLVMYNRQNYGYTAGDPRISQMGITVPFIASDLGYGILFDDYNEARLILGPVIRYESDTPKPLSYYFINGDEGNLASTTGEYSRLTGTQPLPPFWTLGYITSKYGYRTQDETLGVIDTLKRKGYPVDGVVLDLYWYGKETDMGRLEWNKEQWPDPRKMLDELKARGVSLVAISQPYINKKGAIDNYNLLSGKGMLVKDAEGKTHDVTTWVGDAGMLDVSNPATREWLWTRLKGLTADGLAGWWGDLGEPEVHPRTMVHANGETASQYHNVYGNEWSRLIYEGLRKDFPGMRPMLLMRGGTAGLQRYAVFPWSTDVSRSWGGLQPQVNIMLNSGLSGLGYMSSDLGGFAVDEKNPTDPELYLRWVEMGVFTPTFRTHAQQKPEPYNYPAQEKTLLQYVKMRYQWLPYNYTLAYENATEGIPLARPLNFRGENSGKEYASLSDEYLWGDNVLVAPVLHKGERSRKVLFPAGEWYDWWNPARKFRGGSTATVSAPLDRLPLFVRAGAFIPQYDEPIENVSQYNPQFLTVKYFPAKEWSNYTLYDDDRISPTALEDGAYQLITFSGSRQGSETYIAIESNGGRYEDMPDFRMLTFEVMDCPRKPRSVEADNGVPMPQCVSPKAIRQSGWSYDAATRTLTLRLPWDYRRTMLTIR